MNSVRISKYLARILRHDPAGAGIVLDPQGWASVADVLTAVGRRFGGFGAAELTQLVRANDKQRLALSPDGARIRANQGHSVAIDLGLEPMVPPPLLYHGTKADRLLSIIRDGLQKGRRTHVHLSADAVTAVRVGSRRPGPVAVLGVRSGDMQGHAFYCSANGVWLTDYVPPAYLFDCVR
ncbi:MAG: RNA:NAD 2'-phosphotransferase [uncultured Sphingomonadaceae bacterium]|uniref:Probable RNA 2'-phosphotransferase n=1 Tax=uncultured Sphingomonadaceae bacterium TaxID=169976 RepID=A0A6J4RVM3_9SPHN|nr:MAG: RNA:NAD 2'-phosphotransferase [uncultured Sphingomonadaceae bacterium]